MMNLASRLCRSAVALAVLAGMMCCWRVARAAAADGPKDKMILSDQYAEQEKLLKQKLDDAELWKDAKRKDELLRCLKIAGALRAKSITPIIVARISYNPNTRRKEEKKRPLSLKHPVYGVLKCIGMPAVPHLLAELKATDPKKAGVEDSYLKHMLLTLCIQDIYEQGGHGRALAKKRLELELAKTKDKKAKANLQAALDHPIFKEEAETKKKSKKE